MKFKLALMISVACSSLFAGIIEVVATGEAEAKPDYFVMDVAVDSFCHETPNESIAANDQSIAQVVKLFNQYKGTNNDRIVMVSRTYVMKNETTCEQKWRASAKLKIHHELIDKGYDLKTALADFAANAGTNTQVMVSGPNFKQFPANYKITKATADKKAWDEAERKFLNIKGRCGFKNSKLVSATAQYEWRPVGIPVEWVKGGEADPLHYENYVLKATWTMKWEVDAVVTTCGT